MAVFFKVLGNSGSSQELKIADGSGRSRGCKSEFEDGRGFNNRPTLGSKKRK